MSMDESTPPEFHPNNNQDEHDGNNNNDNNDEDDDDQDFVVDTAASTNSSRPRASWWKVEMSRGSKYASHVLPESYRLQGDPVLVVTCEPQFRVVSLQLQGIPTTQRNHTMSTTSTTTTNGSKSHHSFYNHQQQHHHHQHHPNNHNFGVSEPLTLEFHARFPLTTTTSTQL